MFDNTEEDDDEIRIWNFEGLNHWKKESIWNENEMTLKGNKK